MRTNNLHYDDIIGQNISTDSGGRRIRQRHALFGNYEGRITDLGNIQVSDWKWDLTENIRVNCDALSELVFLSVSETPGIDSDITGVDGKTCRNSDSGALFFWPRGCVHRLKKDKTVTGLTLIINAAYLADLLEQDGSWGEQLAGKIRKGEPFLLGGDRPVSSPLLREQLRQIRNTQHRGIHKLLLQSRVSEFLCTQLDAIRKAHTPHAAQAGLGREDLEKLQSLREYLQIHFLEEMSMAQLVRISTLNEFKLKKGFRTLFQTTIFRYIQELRMEYAGKILRDQRCSITEVAEKTGYQHNHHFATAFKRHFGVSPREWIK